MVRRLTAVAASVGVVLFASVASAQAKGAFGEQGEFIFSADRLVPLFAYTNNKVTNDKVNPNQSTSVSGSSFSLLYGGNSAGLNLGNVGVGNPTFYTFPRVGFDYTVIRDLTVGGDVFIFFTLGGSTQNCGGSTCQSTDNPGGNAWGIAPRVGYILGMTDLLAFWLRGGISYYHGTSNTDANRCGRTDTNSDDVGVFGLDLDPQLVISPVNHFGFEVGPAIDWGFAGSASTNRPDTPACGSTTSTSVNYTSLNVGVTAGLFGWF